MCCGNELLYTWAMMTPLLLPLLLLLPLMRRSAVFASRSSADRWSMSRIMCIAQLLPATHCMRRVATLARLLAPILAKSLPLLPMNRLLLLRTDPISSRIGCCKNK
jgi:hypothetical protein